jgi:hypothetical protein
MKKLLLSAAVALMMSTAAIAAPTALYTVNVDRCDMVITTPRFEAVVVLNMWAEGKIPAAEVRALWLDIFEDAPGMDAFIDRYLKGCKSDGLPA